MAPEPDGLPAVGVCGAPVPSILNKTVAKPSLMIYLLVHHPQKKTYLAVLETLLDWIGLGFLCVSGFGFFFLLWFFFYIKYLLTSQFKNFEHCDRRKMHC